MANQMMEVRRLLENDVISVDGEVYEIGKAEIVVEPNGTWSTNPLGEWIEKGPQQSLRTVLICQTQRWIGYLYPVSGNWVACVEGVITQQGTFPKEVLLVDPDFHKKVTLN
jgi:hypothetical protein